MESGLRIIEYSVFWKWVTVTIGEHPSESKTLSNNLQFVKRWKQRVIKICLLQQFNTAPQPFFTPIQWVYFYNQYVYLILSVYVCQEEGGKFHFITVSLYFKSPPICFYIAMSP